MIKIISNNKSYIKYKLPICNFYLIQWKPKSKTDIHNHIVKNVNLYYLIVVYKK